MRLYLASGNPGKLREFRDGAKPVGIVVEMLPGFRDIPTCVEDGATFAANARKKATSYSRSVQGLVFADDSGLCVDALNGRPGVHSARYAGEDATDDGNNRKLLAELSQRQTPESSGAVFSSTVSSAETSIVNWPAHYECVITLAEMGIVLGTFEGKADGLIRGFPAGDDGFGYDPYFYAPKLSRTFAELDPQDKFAVSHRGIAFRKMVDYLKETNRLR
jgi:XTP/dITP diphosphohydrolase